MRSVVDVEASSAAPEPPKAKKKDCPDARKAVRYYQRRYAEWRAKMGAGAQVGGAPVSGRPNRKLTACPRYLASVWQRKAYEARKAYGRWHEYHYAWWKWLPDKWARIGACETGYGRRPGRWDWNSGTYQGFAGFYHGTWDQYKHQADPKAGPYPAEAYQGTPRQQYEVALAVWRVHGYGAWGCGGA